MDQQIIRYLSATELFGGLAEDVLAQIARGAQAHRVKPSTLLWDQGAAPGNLVFIVQGAVELKRSDPLSGHDFLIAIYGPGKSVGEENVLLDDACALTATTSEESALLVFDREWARRVFLQMPQVGYAAARIQARRAARLAAEKGVRFIALSRVPFDAEIAKIWPHRLITEFKAVPVAGRGQTMTVAMVNPMDVLGVDEVRRAARGKYVEFVACATADYDAWVTRHATAAPTESAASTTMLAKLPQRNHALQFAVDDAIAATGDKDDVRSTNVSGEQTIALLNQILGDALTLDTSDIHIEPQPEGIVVRYRIDGRLMRRPDVFPLRLHGALVTRLKALAQMNITERRKPQDGRLSVTLGQREVAFRISTVPTRLGENVVIRILDRNNALMRLDRIVLIPGAREAVRELIQQPHGILFITGPTGSGKTTTMYSAILERKDEGVNIVTIEDPVEYSIPGITQVQYNDAIDLGFAEAIKAFMRQDTDIMLIGETRDARTAQNAMQAALSGHLIVTSFHTSSALGTVYRLMEMGIEPFLIANAMAGVVAQRLVRTVCPDCREPHAYPDAVMDRIYGRGGERPQTWKGRGCARCANTGYRGRAAVLEVLPMNEDLRNALALGASMAELRRIAVAGGMISFRDYARGLLNRGITTPPELMRVLYANDDGLGVVSASVRCDACGAMNDPANKFCEECGAGMPGHETSQVAEA